MFRRRLSSLLSFAAVAAFAGCAGNTPNLTPAAVTDSGVRAPAEPAASQPKMVEVTAGDRAAAYEFRDNTVHIAKPSFRQKPAAKPAAAVGYPLDMSRYGGPTMPASNAYNIYVNCKDESCWGHPEEFLKGLSTSAFANLITQYTGGAGSKYVFKDSLAVKYSHPYSNTYYTEDLFAVLAAAVRHFKATGLKSEYHIFLPKGVDTCFDQSTICYSPDNYPNWQFCAYHGAATYGKRYIIYSVEPYASPRFAYGGKTYWGCQNQSIPKGVNRVDSAQASALSHESFESWSDPLPNTGWYNAQFNEEIGDICAYYFMQTLKLGSRAYYIQQEYSNDAHGCSST